MKNLLKYLLLLPFLLLISSVEASDTYDNYGRKTGEIEKKNGELVVKDRYGRKTHYIKEGIIYDRYGRKRGSIRSSRRDRH